MEVEYDDLGCSVGSNVSTTQIVNNILLVPKYEGIVVKKDQLYGLIDSQGNELLPIALESIYSTTWAGEETYYMVYNDQIMNVINYIDTYVRPTTGNSTTNENNTNTDTNEQAQNTTNDTNTVDNTQTTNTANEQTDNNQTDNSAQTNANTADENVT